MNQRICCPIAECETWKLVRQGPTGKDQQGVLRAMMELSTACSAEDETVCSRTYRYVQHEQNRLSIAQLSKLTHK